MFLSLAAIVSLLVSSESHAQTPCVPSAAPIPHVNMEKVRTAWLQWNNRLRRRLQLEPYRLDEALNATAMEWSSLAASQGSIDHKRTFESSYYDYPEIEQWFRDQGVEFSNVEHTTFTENIGWGRYGCTSNDCTRAVIAATRSTQRFFLAERGKAYQPHYASLMNPHFTKIGVGVALDETNHKYYITIHYATAITSSPQLCSAH